MRAHRQRHRQKRKSASLNTVSLVGYTNAGKSTLLNAMTRLAGPEGKDADVLTADMLFATLDPTTRRVQLPGGREILVTDTVGFIQKLPTALVAAFRATLEEIAESDLLIHVVDITHDNASQQASTVGEVLRDLGVTDRPIVTALNKVDLLPDADEVAADLGAEFKDAVAVSAATGQGIEELLSRVEAVMNRNLVTVEVLIPYDHGELVNQWHVHGLIQSEKHTPDGVLIRGKLPPQLAAKFRDLGSQ